MKFVIAFTCLALFFLSSTCNNQKSNPAAMEITGIIEPIGMTSWQYGTHTLSNATTLYALRSKTVDLKKYEGMTKTIKGERVEGYPVENGPEFIEVTEIID